MSSLWRRLGARFRSDPREGDLVTVLEGPYAERSGTVTARDATRLTVYLDDCCQPRLAPEQVRREWRGRGIAGAARQARQSDRAADEFRDIMDRHDGI
jgi:hypothetical protein